MEYPLDVHGYYLSDGMQNIPETQGIFFVYRGVYEKDKNMAILKELIYIGETDNLNRDLNNTNRKKRFESLLNSDECLFFTYAETSTFDDQRTRIANMLITITLPSLNDYDANNDYNHIQDIIKIEGDRHAFLPSRIHF